METFEWVPLTYPSGQYTHEVWSAQFGGGYKQSVGVGVNNRHDEWPLTFQGCADYIAEIRDFIDRHKGYLPFRWFPPLSNSAGLYEAVDYRIVPENAGIYSLSVTFNLRRRLYAPTYSVPPVVSGLPQIGQVISVSQGTWQSEYPMQFEYQWLRNGEPIAGATDQNYTLVDDDLFEMISVHVTASSLGGSTSVETESVVSLAEAQALKDGFTYTGVGTEAEDEETPPPLHGKAAIEDLGLSLAPIEADQ